MNECRDDLMSQYTQQARRAAVKHTVQSQGHLNTLQPSGHYMYRQWSLYVPPLVTICTASGHYTYRQFNTLQPSGHYVYRQ